MNPSLDNDSPATDARIDALARTAGEALRRPAPDNGVAHIRRVRRTQQVTRAALGGTAVVALFGIVTLALARRNEPIPVLSTAVEVTEAQDPNATTAGSVAPPPATTPLTVPESSPASPVNAPPDPAVSPPPGSSAVGLPIVPTTGPPVGAVAPGLVYAIDGGLEVNGEVTTQQVIDPATGEVRQTADFGWEQSQQAQDAVIASFGRPTPDLGDVGYVFQPVTHDSGSLNEIPGRKIDHCAQSEIAVTSPNGSALPEWAHSMSIGSDGRYLVTRSSICPEPGFSDTSAPFTNLPYDVVVQVFDARRPELPGRTLAVYPSGADRGSPPSLSPNGRFAAQPIYDATNDRMGMDLFDLESGDLIDPAAGCTWQRTGFYDRFVGPWAGESSVLFGADCNGVATVVVRDLMPGGEQVRVATEAPSARTFLRLEIDDAHYTTPGDAWFTVCPGSDGQDPVPPRCWVGHGSAPMIELAGVTDASFSPLGFTYGG